jgi:hypothetical protein
MKRTFIFLILAIPLICMAQNLVRVYEYDNAGNRTVFKTLQMNPAPPAPPEDSLHVTRDALQDSETIYFVETIAKVEIKIYPNPTTEKVTLEISNMERLQTGIFKLYSLSGQLLQEQPVHSSTTIVSLAGLPKGAYILKVHINDRIEDWKIIKQ